MEKIRPYCDRTVDRTVTALWPHCDRTVTILCHWQEGAFPSSLLPSYLSSPLPLSGGPFGASNNKRLATWKQHTHDPKHRSHKIRSPSKMIGYATATCGPCLGLKSATGQLLKCSCLRPSVSAPPRTPHRNVGRCTPPAADHVMVTAGVHGTRARFTWGVKGTPTRDTALVKLVSRTF